MKDKNPGKTVVGDEGGKASEPARQERSPIEVAQNPVKDPALLATRSGTPFPADGFAGAFY